ncbi:hypothetical protein G6O67_000289 [Ophiocordyceps sinensis]|uniref:Uncharacterized protein n=2 Tax=Ophiocordyceps sinensis TaxID=72228 RepID=A0A8H4PYN4_9HYPO|nr:hypothetical protein OCS_05960 [Ophiocordyceps sinensis CO18]KAF4512966.1 hypothetical protein G6O67_000289 [Ophiocordyceps sinensis]
MKFNSISLIVVGLAAGALAAPTQPMSPASARYEATAAHEDGMAADPLAAVGNLLQPPTKAHSGRKGLLSGRLGLGTLLSGVGKLLDQLV